jgi:hypothetical protein
MDQLVNSLIEMTAQYGNLTVIVALNEILAIEVEADACCVACQRKAVLLHDGLTQLLANYKKEFSVIRTVVTINSAGSQLVQ